MKANGPQNDTRYDFNINSRLLLHSSSVPEVCKLFGNHGNMCSMLQGIVPDPSESEKELKHRCVVLVPYSMYFGRASLKSEGNTVAISNPKLYNGKRMFLPACHYIK